MGRKPKGKQQKLEGMPEPIFEFEHVAYGDFRFALGGAGDVKVDAPTEQGKRVYFKGFADIVTTKLNKTKGKRTDIGVVRAFQIVKVEDAPDEQDDDEDDDVPDDADED